MAAVFTINKLIIVYKISCHAFFSKYPAFQFFFVDFIHFWRWVANSFVRSLKLYETMQIEWEPQWSDCLVLFKSCVIVHSSIIIIIGIIWTCHIYLNFIYNSNLMPINILLKFKLQNWKRFSINTIYVFFLNKIDNTHYRCTCTKKHRPWLPRCWFTCCFCCCCLA